VAGIVLSLLLGGTITVPLMQVDMHDLVQINIDLDQG